ncbi:MAG: hypothetical protein KGP35_08035 [Bacteroidetes bacterium]|nr:hypothetical protein [Bacteroidota bacterium]
MTLVEVTDKKTIRAFLEMPLGIYRNDPNWIRPLDKDIELVFDKKQNKAFRHGEAIRWILKDGQGKLIGRVAAFVNKKYKTKGDTGPVGGMGFFECINDLTAAHILFEACKQWLQEKGMGAMDGPINFGERDRWWGLQVDGFQQPLYCMNYNPPYYRDLFENYGFRLFFNQYCYALKVKDKLQEKFYMRHAALAKDPAYSARHVTKKELVKFAKDFTVVYNKAWAGHGGLKQMDEKLVIGMFERMKPVMDENISWFAYYNNEPIGFWVNIVDLNQWFKYLNGRFDWWGKLKFLWLKTFRKNKKFNGIIFGVIPEFQAKGVDAYMIVEGGKIIQGRQLYEEYELQWIGDFNPKMMNVAESLGTQISRRLITFRYQFDPSLPFNRHPLLS